MALLTLANLIDEAQDVHTTIPQAKVVRALNKVLRRIYAETTQPEYTTFTTLPKVTTGTVAVTIDSTAVTFSSAVLSSTNPLMLLQIEGSAAWFVLTYASTTTGTLSSKWAEATDAAATYTLVFPAVSLPFAVGSVLRIWREGLGDIEYAGDRGSDDSSLTTSVTGTPTRWSYYLHDSASANPNDDLLRVLLTPAPETREVFNLTYTRRPTLLSAGGATTQTIPLPDVWNEAVIAGTLAYVHEIRGNNDMAAAKFRFFDRLLKQTKGDTNRAGVVMPRRRAYGLRAISPNPENA